MTATSTTKVSGTGKGNEKVGLRREIGLLEAVAITTGGIIGSGIFIAPKGIVEYVGSVGASLLIWGVCGILSIIGALSYAELGLYVFIIFSLLFAKGTMFPSAGGAYTYLYESWGSAVAFCYLWCTIIVGIPLSNAILSLTFAKYIVQPFFPVGCPIPDLAVWLMSAAEIMLLTLINCMDIRVVGKISIAFMYLKIFALGVIITTGVYVGVTGQENKQNFANVWTGTNLSAETVVYSIFSGMFAFSGWQGLTSMMEELKEPRKNLPRAIFLSILIVTVVYILTNGAYFMVLSPAEIISSDAVAVTFFTKFWGYLAYVVPVFVTISTFGSLSISMMTSARLVLQAARCGHFPISLGLISVVDRTPSSAMIFMSTLTILFMCTSDTLALINILSITGNLFQVVVYASSIYFHVMKPEMQRPFQTSIAVPIFNVLVSLLFFLIPAYCQPLNTAISVLLILPGLPIYYLFIASGRSCTWTERFNEWVTVTTQKLLLAVKED